MAGEPSVVRSTMCIELSCLHVGSNARLCRAVRLPEATTARLAAVSTLDQP